MRSRAWSRSSLRWPLLVAALAWSGSTLPGCVDSVPETATGAFLDHEEPSDLVTFTDAASSAADTFDAARIVAEDFFLAADALDAEGVQAFLEATPYGGRCFLADEQAGPELSAAEALVAAAHESGINPVLLLARMQVEKSLISRTTRPRQSVIDAALGCGCPDGQACDPDYAGLYNQLRCSARSLANLHQASVDDEGQWRAGEPRRSLDGRRVTPASHATAALYGYTPWVLPGRGGNWLVWNITRRFARQLESDGWLAFHRDYDAEPWIGSPCQRSEHCGYVLPGGSEGFCLTVAAAEDETTPAQGVCTLACDGYCPDRSGEPATFCAALPESAGQCLSRAASGDEPCDPASGTGPLTVDRFIDQSSANPNTATVCAPR